MADVLIVSLALALWIALLSFFRAYRIWLPFYVLGAVGLAGGLVYFGRDALPLEETLKLYTGLGVHAISSLAGIETKLFDGVPGALLVLITSGGAGWTAMQIDIECSGLLESSVLIGLMVFYPGWSMRKKASLASIGLAATYFANLVRLFTIVYLLHLGGKDTLLVSHTIIGRALFFAIVVLVYWFVLTRPTIATISANLKRGAAA